MPLSLTLMSDELGEQLFGIEPSQEGNEMVKGMLRDNVFGLQGFTPVGSGKGGMLNYVERAQRLGKWTIFPG